MTIDKARSLDATVYYTSADGRTCIACDARNMARRQDAIAIGCKRVTAREYARAVNK